MRLGRVLPVRRSKLRRAGLRFLIVAEMVLMDIQHDAPATAGRDRAHRKPVIGLHRNVDLEETPADLLDLADPIAVTREHLAPNGQIVVERGTVS